MLRIRSAQFNDTELQAWRAGKYDLLKECSRPLKRILRNKARVRPGRRFFGEAYVAATEHYEQAWYGSFKWLTSPKWCGNHKLVDGYQTQFRDALQRHFPELNEFQQMAMAVGRQLGEPRPVGPDLWLTTRSKHRFVEVKLPGDRLRRHQLVGLALIAMFLRGDRPVSVEVVNLYGAEEPLPFPGLADEFESICRQMKSLPPSATAAQHRDGAIGA